MAVSMLMVLLGCSAPVGQRCGAPVVCAATHLEEYVENLRPVQCHAAGFAANVVHDEKDCL